MSNWIVTDGNELKFDPQFGSNTVTPTEPCLIHGSGEASILNKKICILGDERRISISAVYTKPPYQTPGTGKITLTRLAVDNRWHLFRPKSRSLSWAVSLRRNLPPAHPPQILRVNLIQMLLSLSLQQENLSIANLL